MNLRNTFFALIMSVGRDFMQSQWPAGKWIDKGCCLVIICGTWRCKRGFLNLSYREKGKSHKQEELLWDTIKNLPKELINELPYLELPTISAFCGVKIYMHYIIFLLTKTHKQRSLNQFFLLDLFLFTLLIFLSICKWQLNEHLLFLTLP